MRNSIHIIIDDANVSLHCSFFQLAFPTTLCPLPWIDVWNRIVRSSQLRLTDNCPTHVQFLHWHVLQLIFMLTKAEISWKTITKSSHIILSSSLRSSRWERSRWASGRGACGRRRCRGPRPGTRADGTGCRPPQAQHCEHYTGLIGNRTK